MKRLNKVPVLVAVMALVLAPLTAFGVEDSLSCGTAGFAASSCRAPGEVRFSEDLFMYITTDAAFTGYVRGVLATETGSIYIRFDPKMPVVAFVNFYRKGTLLPEQLSTLSASASTTWTGSGGASGTDLPIRWKVGVAGECPTQQLVDTSDPFATGAQTYCEQIRNTRDGPFGPPD